MWILDTGVRLDNDEFGSHETWQKANDVIRDAVGKESESVGTGFGVRDQQFCFETEEEADAAEERVIQATAKAKLILEYSSVYEEDEEDNDVQT